MGKIATVFQMGVVVWVLLGWDSDLNVGWFRAWSLGAAICTGASGLLYVFDGIKQLGSHPASSAKIQATDTRR